MRTAEEITQWLHSQFWFDAFKENVINHWARSPKVVDRIMSGRFGDDTIEGAFIWGKTPEGFDYWNKIDKDFRQRLNDNRKTKEI